jgi:subtilase family protein
MNTQPHDHRRRSTAARPLLGALVAITALLALAAGSAGTAAAHGLPLSPSEYGVSALCSTPAPGYSGCLGLRLVAADPEAVPNARVGADTTLGAEAQAQSVSPPASSGAPDVGAGAGSGAGEDTEAVAGQSVPTVEFTEPIRGSLSPSNILSAYGLTGATPPTPQTIALVDAYDDATIEHDLDVFDKQFGLSACTAANGCLRKVNQSGKATPLPASSGEKERGWAQEIATDVEVSHGVCPSCQIVLVETNSNSNASLYAGEQTAAALGANEISNSWGGQEPNADNAAFNHPGIVITASSGDYGYLDWFSEEPAQAANYPASSPHVVAVGGTRLTLSAAKTWESESVWNDGGSSGGKLEGSGADGGGCSGRFGAPAWQLALPNWGAVGCGTMRAVSDISADGDPYSGVAVYDSTESPRGEKGWAAIGGTSVASPIIAAAFALAGGSQGVAYPARLLYENLQQDPASLHDVVSGSNGECLKKFKKNAGTSGCTVEEEAHSCTAQAICLAGSGYDGPSGVGTPNGLAAFQPPVNGGGSGGGAEPAVTPAPGIVSPPASGTSSPGAVAATPTSAPVVSALKLTRSALAALTRPRAKVSKVGYAFTINAAARVRVTIAKRIRVRGHLRWKTISAPITFTTARGSHTGRLTGRTALPRGQYRLTLTPERGTARSIAFQIR